MHTPTARRLCVNVSMFTRRPIGSRSSHNPFTPMAVLFSVVAYCRCFSHTPTNWGAQTCKPAVKRRVAACVQLEYLKILINLECAVSDRKRSACLVLRFSSDTGEV